MLFVGVLLGEKMVSSRSSFRTFLRAKNISHVAIDEAKRPVTVDKNFEFLVFAKKVFIVDVKGKQIPYKRGSGFL
jgi:hypothetical protein